MSIDQCSRVFRTLYEVAQENENYNKEIAAVNLWYSLWAVLFEAAGGEDASSKKSNSTIVKILGILEGQVQKALEILQGKRIPFELLPSYAEGPNVEPEEDSPWEVSSEDSTGLDPNDQSIEGDRLPAPLKRPPQKTTELSQLVESIETCVGCLYKNGLPKSVPVDPAMETKASC